MREPYILYRRPDGAHGGKMFYVAFWVQDGAAGYTSRRAVGSLVREITAENLPPEIQPTIRAGARLIVDAWLKTHMPAPGRSTRKLFCDYLETFWADDGAYARALRARGRSISTAYLADNRSKIGKYALPFLSAQPAPVYLQSVTPALIESLIMERYKDGKLSSRTINAIRQAVSVPLAEAARLGLIVSNPAVRVTKLAEKPMTRQILSKAEAQEFFRHQWTDPRLAAVHLLAATTGMRLGECRGLQVCDIDADSINVCHNWQDGEGLKAPKWGSARFVPLPARTGQALAALAAKNPWSDGFVFFGSSKGHPISKMLIDKDYREVLASIKIDDEARKARGLTFHSWRHWYNSMLRGQVPDHSLRALTGHHSEAMTEHYTEIPAESRKAVAELADELI
jgi:integrase